MSNKDGVWGLNITKVGHEDAGVYVCQTDDPDRGTVSVRLNIKGTPKLQAISFERRPLVTTSQCPR